MKNYVITGSIGHISKPIVQGLVNAGKNVKVITSSIDRAKEIEKLGATAEVGSVHDHEFLKRAFANTEVVYTMIPPIWVTDNWRASQNEVGRNYAEALKFNNVKYVVNLSSIGADIGNGIGPVDGVYDFEQMLNKIPAINVKHLRPSFFFYNLLAQIPLIKQAGIMGANYGEEEKLFLVHTNDIASAALEELLNVNFSGSSVRYIIGDERSGKEIAAVLGKAINKELPWVVFSDEEQRQGLIGAGLSATHADGYTQMGKALRDGVMQRDAVKNKPAFSPTKLEDFAKEFAAVYSQQ
jgi:uncharacterized protein YbjT (DUF2867 family)